MPQLLVLGLAGLGIYAAAKWWQSERTRINAKLHEARGRRDAGQSASGEQAAASSTPRELGTLRQDPETGVYRAE